MEPSLLPHIWIPHLPAPLMLFWQCWFANSIAQTTYIETVFSLINSTSYPRLYFCTSNGAWPYIYSFAFLPSSLYLTFYYRLSLRCAVSFVPCVSFQQGFTLNIALPSPSALHHQTSPPKRLDFHHLQVPLRLGFNLPHCSSSTVIPILVQSNH